MRLVYKIDLVLVICSLLVLIFLVGYARPLVISPMDGYSTSEEKILFSIDRADYLYIDDNEDFTTPDKYEVREGLNVMLSPGEYYWKVSGIFGSEVRKLTVLSEVSLELRDGVKGFEVVNVGKDKLNVDVYDGDELIDKIKLGKSESVESLGDKFVGSYDE